MTTPYHDFADRMKRTNESQNNNFRLFFNVITEQIHLNAIDKGWWDEQRNDGELIALMHAELSEMLEYLRKGNGPSDHIPDFSGAEEEAADLLIRLCDMCVARKWRLAEAVVAKMEFNKTRAMKHGKKF